MSADATRCLGGTRAEGLLFLLLALVALGALAWRGGTVAFPDEAEYLALARTLLESGTLGPDATTPSAYRLPLYPAFLAALLAIADRVAAVQAVQLALWLVTGALLARTARSLAGAPAGLLALALWGAYPQGLFLATTLYPQALLAPLMALSLWLALGRPSLGRAAALGSIGGIATLCVANAAVPTFLHLALLATRRPIRHAAPALALGALLMAVPIAGWMARNAGVLGGAWVLSTNSGINLLLGNAPGVTPATGSGLDLTPYAEVTRGMGEFEADRTFRAIALEWIRAHPAEAAWLYLGKLAYWLAPSNRLTTAAEEGGTRDAVAAAGWFGFLLAVSVGTILAARRGRSSTHLLLASWGAWLATAAVYAVFFTRVRFRVPFDVLLVPIGAVGLAGWLVPRGTAMPTRSPNQEGPNSSSIARATRPCK